MKGTIYGNRLPRSTEVRKGWEPLPYIMNIMCCIALIATAVWGHCVSIPLQKKNYWVKASYEMYVLNSKIENAHWAEKKDHNALWH